MINEDGYLNLAELDLDEDAKYYVRNPSRSWLLVEMKPEVFKSFLVEVAKSLYYCDPELPAYNKHKNNLDYMKRQLPEDVLFYLDMVSYDMWIYKP